MKDTNSLAYINLFAVLGAIPELCRMDAEAGELVKNEKISLGFTVKNGPSATLIFNKGKYSMKQGLVSPTITLPFSSAEKFNAMIDGTYTPVPVSGFHRIGFLLKKFMKLTDLLESYLRPEPEKLEDPVFFEKSTVLMIGVIARAVSVLGNNDPISKTSASYIVDGDIRFGIKNGFSLVLRAEDHKLRVVRSEPFNITSYMEFKNLETARALFDGKINAVAAVGMGDVRIAGNVSQIDNVNRILDRVSEHLA